MICLTFDVEERFHSHLTPADAPRNWEEGARLERIVDFLESKKQRATFFMVSELAEQYKETIRRIADRGFEIASHSHSHLRLDGDDRERCKQDIAHSKKVLEDLIGKPLLGFRAPSWSARLSDTWLWEHLTELGFRYDSSLFPFRTHRYGSMSNPLTPFRHASGLLEIPPSVTRLGPLRVPYGGGFYFRLYPRWLTRRLIERELAAGHKPIVYFHPWEFDPDSRQMEAGLLNRFIANYNSEGNWESFTDLLSRYRTEAMADLFEALSAA